MNEAKLPPHEPTIAIAEILADYIGDDRTDVWESIQAYAECYAREAIAVLIPPAAASGIDYAKEPPYDMAVWVLSRLVARLAEHYGDAFPDCDGDSAEDDVFSGIVQFIDSRPAAVAGVPDETTESIIAAYKAGVTHGRDQPEYEFEFASGSPSDSAYAIGYNDGYEQRLDAPVHPAEAKAGEDVVRVVERLLYASQHCGESSWCGEDNPWEDARAMLAAKAKEGGK